MVGNNTVPPVVDALSTYVRTAIDEVDRSTHSFEAIERDCKRAVLQSILVAGYARENDIEPVEAWESLRREASSNPQHALFPLFDTDAIDLESLPVAEILSAHSSTWQDDYRVVFQAVSDALESFTEYQPQVDSDGSLRYEPANDDRRVSGTYLTPVELATRAATEAVERKFRERCERYGCWPGEGNSFENTDFSKIRDVLSSLSVVDPACGTGSMLLGVIDTLSPAVAESIEGSSNPSRKATKRAKQEIIQESLYGADANRLSTEACLAALWFEGQFDLTAPGPNPDRFVVGDSLRGPVRQQRLSDVVAGGEEGTTYREELQQINWGEEFNSVFSATDGFDIVITNPPWERVKVQTREFLAARQPQLAEIATSAARGSKISNGDYEEIQADLEQAREQAKAYANEIRNSSDYQWTNVGMLNLYSLFVERSLQLAAPDGYCSLIVPTGIATDYYTSDFFEHLTTEGKLVSLYDFENREKLFDDVDGRTRFSLLTLTNRPESEAADYVFFAHTPSDIDDSAKHVRLSPDEIGELNPLTKTAPLVRGKNALEILQKQHQQAPILVGDAEVSRTDADVNPWDVSYERMFDMSTDSDKFVPITNLSEGQRDSKGQITLDDEAYLRLYEGRMVNQYNHRASHAKDASGNLFRSGTKEPTERDSLSDPDFTVNARYYLPEDTVESAIPDGYQYDWFIGFKDITSATNSRTMIASVLPRTAVGNKLPLLLTSEPPRYVACLLANLNSMAYDFACRQKIGNVTLNWYIVRQTPVFPPERYDATIQGEPLVDWISSRVAELTYTARDLDAWGSNLGFQSEPYEWDSSRRRQIRAELDGLFFNLYDLTEEEVEYVVDSFGALRRRDEDENGDYEYKTRVLSSFRDIEAKLNLE
ncbi:Eco57I restriction-modification methylase domain-containing protein [Halorussus sp. MSC15.2]|uniref:Eco57I restriction-modification methylase domain-containing protein n=1 Tax=Halorussus sp. MSC15.2 TaxID=2283638 RepID=UPI0013D64A56|nr:Eco57I restriction-modification methylase domain-containing protein [Halorussus sp. MSC15.2]NEU56550.1 hypothetical protein [Halorussus sp. MSC15.2]